MKCRVIIHPENDICWLALRGVQAGEILSSLFPNATIVSLDLSQPSVIVSNPHYINVVSYPPHSLDILGGDSSLLSTFSLSPSIVVTCYPPGRLGNSASGYNLAIPRAQLSSVWEQLQSFTILNITHSEWFAIHTCFGIPLFPFDFPDTPSGMSCVCHHYLPPYADTPIEQLTNHPKFALFHTLHSSIMHRAHHTIYRSIYLVSIERSSSVVRSMLPNRRNFTLKE